MRARRWRRWVRSLFGILACFLVEMVDGTSGSECISPRERGRLVIEACDTLDNYACGKYIGFDDFI